MRISHIRPGDIVQINDGLPYYAIVLEPAQKQRLRVVAISGPRGDCRTVRARQVIGLWRRACR
jgi:hypothetical protein